MADLHGSRKDEGHHCFQAPNLVDQTQTSPSCKDQPHQTTIKGACMEGLATSESMAKEAIQVLWVDGAVGSGK